MDMNVDQALLDDISSDSTNENQTDDNMLPIELTNATWTYVLDLNDYCLLEIFSSIELTPMDLVSLAETCKRFQQITQRVFPKHFGIERYFGCDEKDLGYKFKSRNYNRDNYTLQDVERTLKNFGPRLSTLKLDRDFDVVDLVAKYCGDITLKRLEISRFTSSIEDVRLHLNSIFQRMLELSIRDCDLLITSIDWDSSVELNMVDSNGCAVALKHTFPKLERFTWNYFNSYARSPGYASDICVNFIRRHGRLKTVNVKRVSLCIREFLHAISSSCKELEELTVLNLTGRRAPTDFGSLETFAKLQLLDLDLEYTRNYSHVIALFQHTSRSLATLKLRHLQLEAAVPLSGALSQLQNLRELYVYDCPFNRIPWTMLARLRRVYLHGKRKNFHGSNLLSIIWQLITLEELEYDHHVGHFNLSEKEFSEIVKLVERREHVLILKCCFRFHYFEKWDDNRKVRLLKKG